MKNNHKAITTIIIVIMTLAFLTAGHAANTREDNDTLAVKRQMCFLKNYSHIQEKDCGLAVIADLPVKGSKSLVDSITVFLNEELYGYFDPSTENKHLLPYEKVFSSDIPQLLKHYRKVYRPYFDEKNPDMCEFATHCLELNMVAQTATYVTYEVVDVFFGEGLEEARTWVTFAKSDGHRLREIITDDNLVRFLREHTDRRDNGVLGDIVTCMENGDFSRNVNAGLLNDSIAFQFIWAPGIFDDSKYDLAPLKPYLTEKAQKLVEER